MRRSGSCKISCSGKCKSVIIIIIIFTSVANSELILRIRNLGEYLGGLLWSLAEIKLSILSVWVEVIYIGEN